MIYVVEREDEDGSRAIVAYSEKPKADAYVEKREDDRGDYGWKVREIALDPETSVDGYYVTLNRLLSTVEEPEFVDAEEIDEEGYPDVGVPEWLTIPDEGSSRRIGRSGRAYARYETVMRVLVRAKTKEEAVEAAVKIAREQATWAARVETGDASIDEVPEELQGSLGHAFLATAGSPVIVLAQADQRPDGTVEIGFGKDAGKQIVEIGE